MPAATLTEKGQIVIPAEIRARYHLTPGHAGGVRRRRRHDPAGLPAQGGTLRSGGGIRDD